MWYQGKGPAPGGALHFLSSHSWALAGMGPQLVAVCGVESLWPSVALGGRRSQSNREDLTQLSKEERVYYQDLEA